MEYKKGSVLSNGYVLGLGKQPLGLTETQIRYAMKNSVSNATAALFLRVSYNCYKKYAKQYIDEKTGKNLFDLHKRSTTLGLKPKQKISKKLRISLDEILSGKHPDYTVMKLKYRLSKVGHLLTPPFEHCCHVCGYNEKRLSDGKIPLILDHLDDDWKNHRIENLMFVCFNCYHNTRGNFRGTQPQFRIEKLKKYLLNRLINEIKQNEE